MDARGAESSFTDVTLDGDRVRLRLGRAPIELPEPLAGLVLDAVAAGEDPGSARLLARYQAMRRPDSLLMLGGMHALEQLFGNDLGPVRLVRRLGIAAVDRLPRLKRVFATKAMGLSTGALLRPG